MRTSPVPPSVCVPERNTPSSVEIEAWPVSVRRPSTVRPPVTDRPRTLSMTMSLPAVSVTPLSVPDDRLSAWSDAPFRVVMEPPLIVAEWKTHVPQPPFAPSRGRVEPALLGVPVRVTVPPLRLTVPRPAVEKLPPRVTFALVREIVPAIDQFPAVVRLAAVPLAMIAPGLVQGPPPRLRSPLVTERVPRLLQA